MRVAECVEGKPQEDLQVSVRCANLAISFNTLIPCTVEQFRRFDSEGNPKPGAVPRIAEEVSTFKEAINVVIHGAIAAGMFDKCKRSTFIDLFFFAAKCIRENKKYGINRGVGLFLSPVDVVTCQECIFKGERCKAPWKFEGFEVLAPCEAYAWGACKSRQVRIGNYTNVYQKGAQFEPQEHPDMVTAFITDVRGHERRLLKPGENGND